MSAWVLRRRAARVVLLNEFSEILLIRAQDPADPGKAPWWEIPGGGIDPGETSAEAAARELREEAGVVHATVGPVVWVKHVEFDFGGYHFDQDEVLHVASTRGRVIAAPQGLEALETLAFKGARWWTLAEVEQSAEPFLPAALPTLLPQLVHGPLPDPPLDISPS